MSVMMLAFVLGTLLWRPRIWLHDFPEDVQARALPKTPELSEPAPPSTGKDRRTRGMFALSSDLMMRSPCCGGRAKVMVTAPDRPDCPTAQATC